MEVEQFFLGNSWFVGYVENIVDKLRGCNNLGVLCPFCVEGIILQFREESSITTNILPKDFILDQIVANLETREVFFYSKGCIKKYTIHPQRLRMDTF